MLKFSDAVPFVPICMTLQVMNITKISTISSSNFVFLPVDFLVADCIFCAIEHVFLT